MAQDTKFGTFGGVFTPSVLTILGVIMYLRLPWVAGNAGLYAVLGIIGVAHVISWCTGLSISSIATDKKVGAGGPYYIVSRSLGLPIGGTLGVALFLGLSFSISLYIIGFSESMLGVIGYPVTPNTIRIAGSATLLVLTIITLVSTAVAIKTQYLIMALIAASLVSIGIGVAALPPTAPQLQAPEGGASLAVLFGIFFPAVTGFTAGVNMSGDLRNPTKSIPTGTILAIGTGMLVYVAMAVGLVLTIPTQRLIDDPDILLHVAAYPPAVIAGVWGATLSSALGSILGAPRILQALASDHIGPHWFAKGYGPTSEPRNALLLAFVIGEAGILIAELNAIARIVSMVFLTTYGFLNFSCAIESWASPDFRPQFRIPKVVSVVGAVTCVLIMVQLDLLAMLGATAFMAGLWLLLSRRQLTLDAGDAWEGIWSSLVRSGLYRLSRERRQQRNWRPNILHFHPPAVEHREAMRGFATTLISGNGILTEIELGEDEPDDHGAGAEETQLGIFREWLPRGDPYQTIGDVCRYRGFTALQPNTVLLDWTSYRGDAERFGELVDLISQLDHNLLVYAANTERSDAAKSRIDVWWRTGAGNVPLCLALVRFVTRARQYRNADVRFLLMSRDSSANDHLRSVMRGLLTSARVDAAIRIVNNTLDTSTFEEHVRAESSDAELTILGLPLDPDQCGPRFQLQMGELVEALPSTLLVRGNSTFKEVLTLSRQATISFLPPRAADGSPPELPELTLPSTPAIADAVTALADGYQRLVSSFHRSCVRRVYGVEIKLVEKIRDAIERHFGRLEKQLVGANPRRQRNLVNRMQSSLLLDCDKIFEEHADRGLTEQRAVLEGRTEAFLGGRRVTDRSNKPTALLVERRREDFAADPKDPPYLRRFKRRRRWGAVLGRRQIRYRIPVATFQAHYFEQAIDVLLTDTLRQLVTDSHHLMVHLGKILSSQKTSLALPSTEVPPSSTRAGTPPDETVPDDALTTLIEAQKSALLDRLEELAQHGKERIGKHQWELLGESRRLVQSFADDIDRLDARRLARKERRVRAKLARRKRAAATELPLSWYRNQKLILDRARLGLKLASFQHRLVSAVEREKQTILLQIRNSVLGECEKLEAALESFGAQITILADEEPTLARLRSARKALDVHLDLQRRFDAEHVADSLVQSTTDLASTLPQWQNTLSDASIQQLEEGQDEEVETVEVPVFRLAQFLVEAKLIGQLQGELEKIPRLEQRAAGVAHDVMRLVTFQLGELDAAVDENPGAYLEQVAQVVESGIARLDHELRGLRDALSAVARVIDEQLRVVLDGTNPYDLSSTSADLEQHIRRHHGQRAVSGLRWILRRGSDSVREVMVNLVYRRSAGLLMARELRTGATQHGKLVDRVLSLVERHMPRPEVIEQLPPYYRQLFVGQTTVNETFWVDREVQLGEARRALSSFGRGARGAIVVIGEGGSGKSALLQRITSDLLGKRDLLRVFPQRGGTVEAAEFLAALRSAASLPEEAPDPLDRVADKSVVLIDDLELWWERGQDGLAVIDLILELIARHGERVLFVIGVSTQALAFINRYRALADAALAVIECGPLPAEVIKSIVMLRHGSTGLKFDLAGTAEDDLSDWRLARLFSSHFDYSGGHVGAALRSWITHIGKVTDASLQISLPDTADWDLLDELRPAWIAVLLQLILHKQLDRERLVRLRGGYASEVGKDVDTLLRMRLCEESQRGVITINPFVYHALVARFTKRGLLA